MTVLVIPDPLHAGTFAVAVKSMAGTNVVGGRLVHSTTVLFPEDSPRGLTEEAAQALAEKWEDALDEQAGKKEKRVRKRKQSKVILRQWDNQTK